MTLITAVKLYDSGKRPPFALKCYRNLSFSHGRKHIKIPTTVSMHICDQIIQVLPSHPLYTHALTHTLIADLRFLQRTCLNVFFFFCLSFFFFLMCTSGATHLIINTVNIVFFHQCQERKRDKRNGGKRSTMQKYVRVACWRLHSLPWYLLYNNMHVWVRDLLILFCGLLKMHVI